MTGDKGFFLEIYARCYLFLIMSIESGYVFALPPTHHLFSIYKM